MTRLKFAIHFLKFLPLPSLQSFVLSKAVMQGDIHSVEQLTAPHMVARFSALEQSVALVAALERVLQDRHKDTARKVVHTLLDRGLAFTGEHEINIRALAVPLMDQKETDIVLKLCQRNMSENSKIDTFVDLVRHRCAPEFVSTLYNMWREDLKGSAEVPEVRVSSWFRLSSDHRGTRPTLLEFCLVRAPEHIVHVLLNDCERVTTEECAGLMKRDKVSENLLEALVEKGLDVAQLLEITEQTTDTAFQTVAAYHQARQQKHAIERAIARVEPVTHVRRKM